MENGTLGFGAPSCMTMAISKKQMEEHTRGNCSPSMAVDQVTSESITPTTGKHAKYANQTFRKKSRHMPFLGF
jgi:hypothetical protein